MGRGRAWAPGRARVPTPSFPHTPPARPGRGRTGSREGGSVCVHMCVCVCARVCIRVCRLCRRHRSVWAWWGRSVSVLRSPTNPPRNTSYTRCHWLPQESTSLFLWWIITAVQEGTPAPKCVCPLVSLRAQPHSSGAILQDTEPTALLIIPAQGYFISMP